MVATPTQHPLALAVALQACRRTSQHQQQHKHEHQHKHSLLRLCTSAAGKMHVYSVHSVCSQGLIGRTVGTV
jgi:hypothetical protein